MKFLYRLLLINIIVLATSSCERDDICAEATPTTPHLIIRFYDINATDELKIVRQLSVRGFDADGNEIEQEIVEPTDTDSIALPLRIEGDDPTISTTSMFLLERDRDFFLDTIPTTNSNIDIIKVTYTSEFIYVSRACGYKSIFTNMSNTIEPDINNWILIGEIVNTTIENETGAHIILRH